MKRKIQELQKESERLTEAIGLLAQAAEHAVAARELLARAKHVGADLSDPTLRRLVMKAAGQLKADPGGFLHPNED